MVYGKIIRVRTGSIAEEIGLQAGDCILSVNAQPLRDIIDLSFAMADEEIDLLVQHANGEEELYSFDKEYDEELGVEFASAVFDGIRRCGNKCYFCFVDQVPPHMRDSLYIKDDDYRLSFLYGNFVTLTNLRPEDVRRIRQFHLSPLYVSVHTTNPTLREKMLGTPRAASILEQLDRFAEDGIEYHTQIVLCPGINDAAELDRTLQDLADRAPAVLSVAAVPVGLTAYREDCYPLSTFRKEDAVAVIRQAEKWQKRFREEIGTTFFYLGDEFYLLAEEEVPPAAWYDDFPQLDNGIGLLRNFLDTWSRSVKQCEPGYAQPLRLDVVCGTAVAPRFSALLASLSVPNLSVRLVPVKNRFFGESVNVSGLLTGQDMLHTLQETQGMRDGVIFPRSSLREGENIFLDDMTMHAMAESLGVPVATASTGDELYRLLTAWDGEGNTGAAKEVYAWQSNAAYTKTEGKR